jgi:CarboxypepD_reg-like domain/TonB-dependent Receptor Plug Domain
MLYFNMMKRLKHLIILLLLISNSAIYAQNVLVGTVKEVDTGKPIAGATLSFDYEKTGIVTDSLGHFRLPTMVNGIHAVTVRHVAYKSFSKRLDFYGEFKLDIELVNIQHEMEEVIVSSQTATRSVETPSLGVNLLSLKSVTKLPPAAGEIDLFRGIQMLPGVTSVGEGSNGVNVRGGNVDQNWVFIDNMPIFNPSHLLGLFSIFPADALREVQLYKGSIPARYGGRTSSVMDVKMIEPSLDGVKIKGGIGMISNRLNVEMPLIKGKLAFLTSARLSYNQYLINNANFYDIANKILYKPNINNSFTFSNYLSNDSYAANGLFSISEGLADNTIFKYGHQNYSLRWNRYFNAGLNFNLIAVSSRYANKTSVPKGPAPLDLTSQLNYKNIRGELTYLPTAKHKLNIGLTGTRYDLNPGNLQPKAGSSLLPLVLQSEQAYEAAFYASDEYEISSRILVELGFRGVYFANMGAYNQAIYAEGKPKTLASITSVLNLGAGEVEQRYVRPEPRLALRYKISPYSSLKIGYNRMNQFLHLVSNSATPLPNARWKTANRYLRPQQSDLATIGYFRDKPESRWEYSIEGYYRQQKHIFDFVAGANLQTNANLETQILDGQGKAYGAELLLTKKRGMFTGWLSYTYSRTLQQILGDFPLEQQLNTGKWFPSNVDKPHSLSTLLNIEADRHNTISFTFVYSTGRPFTAPVGSYRTLDYSLPIFYNRNNSRISDYHRLDFSWTITPLEKHKHWKGNWVFAIYNVYGRKNAYNYFYKKSISGLVPYKISVFPSPLPSLTYNVTFE